MVTICFIFWISWRSTKEWICFIRNPSQGRSTISSYMRAWHPVINLPNTAQKLIGLLIINWINFVILFRLFRPSAFNRYDWQIIYSYPKKKLCLYISILRRESNPISYLEKLFSVNWTWLYGIETEQMSNTLFRKQK